MTHALKPVPFKDDREITNRRAVEYLREIAEQLEKGEWDTFVGVLVRRNPGGSISHRLVSAGGGAEYRMAEIVGLDWARLSLLNAMGDHEVPQER